MYNSISYKCFYGFGDMLIGSKIPPQADIIKIVITGGDPRVAGHDCCREHDYRKKTEQPEIDTTSEIADSQQVSR